MHSGITFLGQHSYKDFGITMAHKREIGIPDKKKIKQSVPFSNHTYDYSEIFGSQVYEERTIKYSFNIANQAIKTKEKMNMVKTEMINWLMTSGGKHKLYDDHYPNYYFIAEVEGNSSFQENWYHGFLEVEFVAYPFMVSIFPEGSDIWDNFNFLFDVSQDLTFKTPRVLGPFQELSVGSQATIGSWASATYKGRSGTLLDKVGITRSILSMSNVGSSNSERSYQLQGITGLVLEQDLIQANMDYVDIRIINNGAASVSPEIRLTSSDPEITIENLDTRMSYNFKGSRPSNDLFWLNSGVNRLRLHSRMAHTVEFIFHKELI